MDDSLDERVRSMVVGLMLNNDRMAARIRQLEIELEGQKREVSKMKEKNGRMKLRLQKLCVFCVCMLMLIVAMCMLMLNQLWQGSPKAYCRGISVSGG